MYAWPLFKVIMLSAIATVVEFTMVVSPLTVKFPTTSKLLFTFAFPLTSNGTVGVVVPIPTFARAYMLLETRTLPTTSTAS